MHNLKQRSHHVAEDEDYDRVTWQSLIFEVVCQFLHADSFFEHAGDGPQEGK